MNNYLKQFTVNQIPTVQADAAVFDLEEGKKAKASISFLTKKST